MIGEGRGEREPTELANGSETGKGGTDGHTGETSLGNGGLHSFTSKTLHLSSPHNESTHVDNPVLSKLVQQSLGDLQKKKKLSVSQPRVSKYSHEDETCLVSTVVPGNLFTDNKDGLVTDHLLLHRLVERVSHSLRVCVSSASISKNTARTIMVTPSSELAALFWAPPSKKADGLLGTMGAAVVRRAFLATSFALAAEVERGAVGARSARGRLRVILEAIVGFGVGGGEGEGEGERFVDLLSQSGPQRCSKTLRPARPVPSLSHLFPPLYSLFIPPPPRTFTSPPTSNIHLHHTMRHIAPIRLFVHPFRQLAARGYASRPLDIDHVDDPDFEDVVGELKRRRRKADAKRRQYVSLLSLFFFFFALPDHHHSDCHRERLS